MKKTLIISSFIILIFLGIGVYLYNYFDVDNSLKVETKKNIKKVETKKIEELNKKQNYSRDYDKRLQDLKKRLDIAEDMGDENLKAVVLFDKSMTLLGKRELKDVLLSVKTLQDVTKNMKVSSKERARAFEKLANMYWRTGGDSRVLKAVFSNGFEKYIIKKNKNIDVFNSIIKLYNKSYLTHPNPRSSIEIAYYEALLNNIDESKKWLGIAESFSNSTKSAGFYYKKYLTLTELDLRDSLDLKNKIDDAYKYSLKSSMNGGELDYDYYNSQGIPFLYLYKANYLYQKDKIKNKREINMELDKIADFVNGDPKPEYNEFLHFLKIQSKKEHLDLVGQFMPELSKFSDKFKKILEENKININHE